jgi:hypothetical protein
VTETPDDELQQGADVVVGFTDEDACHIPRIVGRRRDSAGGMV